MTTLIKQRNSADCGICCTAMMLNMSYAATVRAFGHNGIRNKKPRGTLDAEIVAIIIKYSDHLPCLISSLESHGNPSWIKRHYEVLNIHTSRQIKNLARHYHAILSVPSLNIKGAKHYVYWDTHRIYDPSKKIIFPKWLPNNIRSAIVI